MGKSDEDLFWTVVKQCLEEIYGIQPTKAAELCCNLRTKLAQAPGRRHSDIFYHAEPIHVAEDIAGEKKVLRPRDWKKYDAILAQHAW